MQIVPTAVSDPGVHLEFQIVDNEADRSDWTAAHLATPAQLFLTSTYLCACVHACSLDLLPVCFFVYVFRLTLRPQHR